MSKDFGEILDKWENKITTNKKNKKSKNNKSKQIPDIDMDVALKKYGIIDKDSEYENNEYSKSKKTLTQKQLDNMPPQDEIDLHGMTVLEAQIALDNFFTKCQARKLNVKIFEP